MSEIEIPSSPFDAIKREDELGEHWTGRELMPVMGYGADWRNFVEVVERAKAACVNAKHHAADHIGDATKMVPIGSGALRSIADFRFTRFGAYLVAMNGDPHKREIALAQTYFTAKTRQAELAEEPDELEIARRYVKAIEDKRAAISRAEKAESKLAVAAPKADAWDVLASAHGDYSVGDAAKILCRDPRIRIGQNRLFDLLGSWGWLYRSKSDECWRVMQDQAECGRLSERSSHRISQRTGRKVTNAPQVRVSVKGLKEIRQRMVQQPPLFEVEAVA